MKILSTVMAAFVALGLGFVAVPEAEAKRLGSGSSSGMQRDLSSPSRSATTQQNQASPTNTQRPAAATPPQKRSWMGPLAGIAAAVGLAALASHFGFGEEMASMMMIALVVMAVVAVVGLIMRRRAAAQPAMAGAGVGAMQYAGASGHTPRPVEVAMPAGGGAALNGAGASAPAFPPDFDAEAFARQAKANFIRLQAANDAGNLEDLRTFTTPEMFGEFKLSLLERGNSAQQTDVLEIHAQVLDLVEETGRYVVSVHFHGLMREDQNGPVESISEVWHLVKPMDGSGGWLLAGIQQMQ